MLSYQERCALDPAYKDIIEQIGACYVKLVKVNPDDYKNDFGVAGYIDKIKDLLDQVDQDNSVESDDPTTEEDDVYTVAQVNEAVLEIIDAYESLNEAFQDSADAIIEKGIFTDLKELLFPYNK